MWTGGGGNHTLVWRPETGPQTTKRRPREGAAPVVDVRRSIGNGEDRQLPAERGVVRERRVAADRAETLAQDRPDVRLQLAEARHVLAMETGERSDLERVLSLVGDDPSAYKSAGRAAHILAATHEVLGDSGKALRYYRIAAERLAG